MADISKELFITTSDLTKLELHSALLKRLRLKEISQKEISEVFQLLDNDFQRFNIIVIDNAVKNFAIQLLDNFGIKYSLRTLDSLQLASALLANNYSKIDYFISSDKKLLNIAKEYF